MKTVRRRIVSKVGHPSMQSGYYEHTVVLSCGHVQKVHSTRHDLKQKTTECFRCTHIANGWDRTIEERVARKVQKKIDALMVDNGTSDATLDTVSADDTARREGPKRDNRSDQP